MCMASSRSNPQIQPDIKRSVSAPTLGRSNQPRGCVSLALRQTLKTRPHGTKYQHMKKDPQKILRARRVPNFASGDSDVEPKLAEIKCVAGSRSRITLKTKH